MASLVQLAPRLIALVAALSTAACGDDDSGGDTNSVASSGTTAPATTTASSGEDTQDATTSAVDSSGADSSSGGGICAGEQPSIVTDIDETLTLSDGEFFMQIGDGNYDPVEREGAAELINAYADLGYHVVYLTARSETIMIKVTNETGREATERWLDEHGFPRDPETTSVILAPMFVVGDDAEAYKAQALADEQAAGRRFDYAYGNALSDIGAYATAGIALENTFIIGDEAGAKGTTGVDGDGWVDHHARHVPSVPAVCEEE